MEATEELLEERIGGLDIWDEHVHRVICKGLEMLEDASYEEERCSCVLWKQEIECRQGPIGNKLLQVEDDRSDGIRDLLCTHGRITTRDKHVCGGNSRSNSRETMKRLWKTMDLVEQFGSVP